MTIGASPCSIVTSKVIAATWRWTSDTSRSERTRTSLPAAVRHVMSRLTVPRRRSSTRSYEARSANESSSGSSSTYNDITLGSGTLTIVWPVVANPNACSAWWMLHVSWNPLMSVPGSLASRPSSWSPRSPR